MKNLVKFFAVLACLVAFSLTFESCKVPRSIEKLSESKNYSAPEVQNNNEFSESTGSTGDNLENKTPRKKNFLPKLTAKEQDETQEQELVSIKKYKKNVAPKSLKNPTVNFVLKKDAPEKYNYKYKNIYKGILKGVFPFSDYLVENGQPDGKYPGDALVVSDKTKTIFLFTDSKPSDKWFEVK
jgi:hypothetical protein